jgi:hypothetical protein
MILQVETIATGKVHDALLLLLIFLPFRTRNDGRINNNILQSEYETKIGKIGFTLP